MKVWKKAFNTEELGVELGATVKFGDLQIAVFHYKEDEWYAVQNLCPHKREYVISRGLVGDVSGEPKVACPLHKHPFSLKNGKHLGGSDMCLKIFPVKIESGEVFIEIDE
jgi:nitrite reductase (NADH) small subunit